MNSYACRDIVTVQLPPSGTPVSKHNIVVEKVRMMIGDRPADITGWETRTVGKRDHLREEVEGSIQIHCKNYDMPKGELISFRELHEGTGQNSMRLWNEQIPLRFMAWIAS